jgi:hypothetical protein
MHNNTPSTIDRILIHKMALALRTPLATGSFDLIAALADAALAEATSVHPLYNIYKNLSFLYLFFHICIKQTINVSIKLIYLRAGSTTGTTTTTTDSSGTTGTTTMTTTSSGGTTVAAATTDSSGTATATAHFVRNRKHYWMYDFIMYIKKK